MHVLLRQMMLSLSSLNRMLEVVQVGMQHIMIYPQELKPVIQHRIIWIGFFGQNQLILWVGVQMSL